MNDILRDIFTNVIVVLAVVNVVLWGLAFAFRAVTTMLLTLRDYRIRSRRAHD